jgi:hypothetical protein
MSPIAAIGLGVTGIVMIVEDEPLVQLLFSVFAECKPFLTELCMPLVSGCRDCGSRRLQSILRVPSSTTFIAALQSMNIR